VLQYHAVIVISLHNKMELLWKRIKTEQSTEYLPFNQFYNISQRSGSNIDAAKRSLMTSKVFTSRISQNQTRKFQEMQIRRELDRKI
jgi:hypothetical protein